MNSDFADNDAALLLIERELKSLTPAAPSREFVQRLSASMEPAPAQPTAPAPAANRIAQFPWKRMVTPAAAAAAAVAVMSLTQRRGSNGTASPVAKGGDEEAAPTIKWTPMPMKKEYRQLVDQGYIRDENNVLLRQMLLDGVDYHEWRNDSGNSIRLSIPRQDSVLLPAAVEDETFRQLQFR